MRCSLKIIMGALLACVMALCGCSVLEGMGAGSAFRTDQKDTMRTFSSKGGRIIRFEVPEEVKQSSQTEENAGSQTDATGTVDANGRYVSGVDLLDFDDPRMMEPKSLEGIDPYQDKVIALTFDDGPMKDTTPKLLDILKDNDVNATFFMVGKQASQYPEIVQRAYAEGNELGGHSWDHSSNFLKWSHAEVMDQITKSNDAIMNPTGKIPLFDRPPEGAINADVAASTGRAQIMWSVDPNDWKQANRDPEIVYNNVVNSSDLRDGAIVLSHDIRPTTVDAYDRIIKDLKAQGYKFVTVSQMMQIAQLRGKEITNVFNGAPSIEQAKEKGVGPWAQEDSDASASSDKAAADESAEASASPDAVASEASAEASAASKATAAE